MVQDSDLRNHSTELIFPKLNSGLYRLDIEGITGIDTCSSSALFTVSGIIFSGVDRKLNVMDIESGVPVKGADIEIYDRDNQDWTTGKFHSADDGTIIVKSECDIVRVVLASDTITMPWNIRMNPDYGNVASQQLYFFTDRSIYRPGQTVFFKGILFNKDFGEVNSIVDKDVTVVFRNSNYQSIDTLKLTTNHYGTISGKFKIPLGGLSGDFQLISDNGSVSFRVEEYRRPGFKIEVDDLKGEYRLNSAVEMTGNVTSFSGVPLKNVKGKYRVSRNPVWIWRPRGEVDQFEEGTFTTDKDGKYQFSFLAKPDEQSTEIAAYPFKFEVEIEVTDITGETQSSVKSLNIGKEALIASVDGTSVFDLSSVLKKEELNFSFKVINSDNQEIKSKRKIELIRLKSPQTPLRKRQWTNPDRPIYTQAQWDQLFPGNQYRDEILPLNYEEDKVMQTIDFEKQDTSSANFNTAKLEQGYYKVRITTNDQFGSLVKAEHLVRVYNSSERTFLFPESSWVNLSSTSALPGESIQLLLGNFGTQFWNVQLHRKDGAVTLFNGLVEKTMQKISIPVEAHDQGGLMISVSSMNQGIAYYEVFSVDVPWIQKELKLTVEDFPKIIIPGKEALWKVRVVDSAGKPAKAEIAGVVYDASLDKILPHDWQLKIWENFFNFSRLRYPGQTIWGVGQCTQPVWTAEKLVMLPEFNKVIDYQVYNNRGNFAIRGSKRMLKSGALQEPVIVSENIMKMETVGAVDVVNSNIIRDKTFSKEENKPVEIRSNFRETAWFNAHFETDEEGRAEVRFNLPESVTEWKFMALAHTPEGLSGTITDKFVTQKQLMAEPFPTRFLTVGDEVTFPIKITNLSGKSLNLDVKMEITNIETGKIVDGATSSVKINLTDGKSDAVNWKLSAPKDPGLYQVGVTAVGDGHSDGFESILPVEPDRKWATESKAFTVKPGNNIVLNFNKLGSNDQIGEGKWNLTIMTNPVGLIMDALPQLIGSETFTISGVVSRLNGALILRKILDDHPEIAKELESQRNKLMSSPDSFKTRLEKAEQFTNLKLNETPWLKESMYEKEKLAKFNPDTIKTTISEAINRLEVAQLSDGGFAWCPGMGSSEWVTAQILNDIAQFRLKKLLTESEGIRVLAIAAKGVNYLDRKINEEFLQLKEKDKISYQPSSYISDYLFARSAFKEVEFASGTKPSYNFYVEKVSKNWTKTGIWQQVQLAFVLKREGNEKLLRTVTKSIEERAIKSNELGMYWKQSGGSPYFYREPDIALQSRMIELFGTVNASVEKTDAMKLWLLQQKRTHAWDSQSSTAAAVFALMSGHNESIQNQPLPDLYIDGMKIDLEQSKSIDGFVQFTINQKEINKESRLEIKNSGNNILFGGLYHGYFKQVNDTSRFGSSLKIRKEIFKIERSVRGDSLVKNLSESRPGDLLMVYLLIENDRDLGFVSLDDQRPAGTEPLKQLSEYEYNGGLWYYRVNIDTGTRFFIGNLPKGRFVLEYPVRVSHLGTFSGGRVNIQCSFAPEFGANHSPGRVKFDAK
ncbi:MAG TPA: MG2 domain-containing protein [Prolixibacteraceae bacterium]